MFDVTFEENFLDIREEFGGKQKDARAVKKFRFHSFYEKFNKT